LNIQLGIDKRKQDAGEGGGKVDATLKQFYFSVSSRASMEGEQSANPLKFMTANI
jgi:hypothetical protein